MILQTSDYKRFQISDRILNDFRQANHCLPGDMVEWKEDRCILVKRGYHRFIPGVLDLQSKYVYGHTSRGAKLYLFHPLDPKYPPFRVGSTCRDTSKNQLGLLEFTDWEEFESFPRGNLLRLLGPCGSFQAEKQALLYQYGKPKKAAELFDVEDCSHKDRIRLDGYTCNIDPDGCMDIDDVITLKKVSGTQWEFVITIADVGAYILEGSAGDKHAHDLGQTMYQNGEAVVPMIPAALSEMALSLLPHVTHLGVSLFCKWDTEAKELTVGEFHETIFQSSERYTYETIYKATDLPLTILEDIASYLHGSKTTDSHDWIAEFMILYNKQAALKLVDHKAGLLRTHKPGNQEMLEQFLKIHPDLQALAYEAAKYEPTNTNQIHAGLGSVPYCHVTSPLRRYADLINQRALKVILKGQNPNPVSQELADHLNQIQKQMRRYERHLFFLEQIAKTPTGTVEALVVSSTNEKTKAYVPSWKQQIRLQSKEVTIGQTIRVEYYADLQKPRWNERIVFSITTQANGDEGSLQS